MGECLCDKDTGVVCSEHKTVGRCPDCDEPLVHKVVGLDDIVVHQFSNNETCTYRSWL